MNHTQIDSPIGPVTLVADDGALVGVYMSEHRHHPDAATFGPRNATGLGPVIDQLGEYFAGQRTSFDLTMAPRGTAFQQRVWEQLRRIGYGETVSYGEIARRLGQPGASRAVGLANGRNPISIIVPCHRVVGSNGQLTGYAGGHERKRFLLDLEGATLPGM